MHCPLVANQKMQWSITYNLEFNISNPRKQLVDADIKILIKSENTQKESGDGPIRML